MWFLFTSLEDSKVEQYAVHENDIFFARTGAGSG
jgi:hypothetical protein